MNASPPTNAVYGRGLPPTKPATCPLIRSTVVTLALVLALLGTPVSASAEPGVGAKVADAVLVRPLAIIGASLSTVAFFLAVVPLWVVGVDDRDLAHHMVKRPWHFVHSRDLGDFGDARPSPPSQQL